MTLAEGLNPEQSEVVFHQIGPLLVAAAAGCGKTLVLVRRIARLVSEGVDPARILAVTFSVKAAREMNDRLDRLGCNGVRVGTFHSLALQIVREEWPAFKQWTIDDKDRFRICVKDAVSFKYMNWKTADVTHLLSYIGRCKAAGARTDASDTQALEIATRMYKARPCAGREPGLCRQAYETAEIVRRERMLLTFDDMLLEAWELLSRNEDLRERWALRWDHVLQDEVQDENHVQHELAAMLAKDHRSYMIVGDPAQSIFQFRGASPRMMLRFERDWSAPVIRMGRNYRSGDRIIEIANKSLEAMPADTHLGVKLLSERGESGEVRAVVYEDFDAEGEGVTEKILESHEDGRLWSDHVVLFRTNAQSRGVEEALLSARAPYVVIGGTNFYDRREVKDLLAYLRVGEGRGEFDDVRRCINTPFRYLGKAFLDGLEATFARQRTKTTESILAVRNHVMDPGVRLQAQQRTSAVQWCEIVSRIARAIAAGEQEELANGSTELSPIRLEATPARILETLVSDLRYTEWLTRDEGMESPENNRVSNVRELVRAAGRFPTVGELLDYVDDTLERAARAKRESTSSDVVTLCSIHRSKGLEWPVVFVLGVNDKILPHVMAEDPDEERRLFYVACTRARDVLELSCVSKAAVSNRVVDLAPSKFLLEVGLTAERVAVLPQEIA
jgi:DNA helicase-2/ATP-dependent DNA helicase PcrA